MVPMKCEQVFFVMSCITLQVHRSGGLIQFTPLPRKVSLCWGDELCSPRIADSARGAPRGILFVLGLVLSLLDRQDLVNTASDLLYTLSLGLDSVSTLQSRCRRNATKDRIRTMNVVCDCFYAYFHRALSPCSTFLHVTELRLVTDRNICIRTSIVAASSITVDLRLV